MRGQLSGFLRDTLVGFNYMHYAPPGAQILRTNPLFVRSHDFLGMQGANQTWRQTEVSGTGWPSNARRTAGRIAGRPALRAGRGRAELPDPLAEQALIWGDLVPQMILTATVPALVECIAGQTHWVGLHMAYGESLIGQAALNPEHRRQVMAALGSRIWRLDASERSRICLNPATRRVRLRTCCRRNCTCMAATSLAGADRGVAAGSGDPPAGRG